MYKGRLTIRWSPGRTPGSSPVKPGERSSGTPSTQGERRAVFDRPKIQPDLPRVDVLSERQASCSLEDHQDLRAAMNAASPA